ncbi:MAG: response regulator transcription factor [Actinomycetota bacterium]
MTSRILVVEDEKAISDAVAYALTQAEYDVDVVDTGAAALARARTRAYDLMILDLLLPDMPGLEVCRLLRVEHNDVPIVMLTALDIEHDRVAGLDIGADDYVTKPFSTAELISRVRSHLRRRLLDRMGPAFDVGSLHLDVARHAATLEGRPLPLTRSEFRLVALMAAKPGEPFTRQELVEHLWEGEYEGDLRAVDVHVSNLRRKLETDPRHPRRLVTVRGVGYKLLAV